MRRGLDGGGDATGALIGCALAERVWSEGFAGRAASTTTGAQRHTGNDVASSRSGSADDANGVHVHGEMPSRASGCA